MSTVSSDRWQKFAKSKGPQRRRKRSNIGTDENKMRKQKRRDAQASLFYREEKKFSRLAQRGPQSFFAKEKEKTRRKTNERFVKSRLFLREAEVFREQEKFRKMSGFSALCFSLA